MSKKTSKPSQLEKVSSLKRRKVIVLIGIIMSLVLASVALGQWGGLFATKQKRNKGQEATVTTQSLNDPTSPSKEYIYAGGRLIATEEPASQTPTNNAAFITQSAPTAMNAGQTYSVSVTMSNSGTATWSQGNYYLGSKNPAGNTTWGVSSVNLPSASVAPGGQAAFSFTVTAPAAAGTYNFQWQMLQSGVGYFGALSTNVAVTVTADGANNATFVSQSVPSSMTAGQTYSVSVTMSNSGTTSWTQGAYYLGSQNPAGNGTWGLSQVGLPTSSVSPGNQAAFTFSVTAPTTAGSCDFQWQMQQSGVGYFGQLTTNQVISGVGSNKTSRPMPTSRRRRIVHGSGGGGVRLDIVAI
jgi:hypothetical protein